jgi:HD-GYP domain-containing protein (c-di-GMP phosphodiesterase class II)
LSDNSIKEIKEKQEVYESRMDNLGRKLVNVLFATIKVATMYEANNNRYIDQAARLREILTEIFAMDPDFTLTTRGGHFFMTDIRLKADREMDAAMTYFLERWLALGVSGLSFSNDLDPRELDKFIFCLAGFEPGEDPQENQRALKERMSQLQIEKIAVITFSEDDEAETEVGDNNNSSTRATARKAFFNAIAVVQDTISQARSTSTVNIAKTKRVVQQLINHIIDDEAALVEMVSLRNFDDYTYVHSVNVCVLSLVLGFHLGLDRRRLSNLGVGALLHDIGKTKLPIELVNKPDVYDEYDWQMMRKHPIFGVKALLKTRVADETAARASAAVFEHHLAFDGSGYPELLNKRKPSLFACIVAIADSYNAMTSGRVYHVKRLLPDEAISNMVNRVGKAFDPMLLKVFINTMGIYPVGSVVALSSKEIGIVSRTNPDDLEKPQVKVIANEEGLLDISEVKILDLSKEPGVRVTRIIDDDKYHIDIANYLDIG